MNTPNPLLPQGALPPRGPSSLYFKILMIISVHIVVIGGILMVGCKDTARDKAKTDQTMDMAGGPAKSDVMSSTPSDIAPAPAPIAPPTATPSLPAGNLPMPPVAALPSPVSPVPPTVQPAPPIPAITGGSVYVIARGDLLSTIATKNGVSLKALEDANPGLDPKKLQIGHKLQIPAGAAVASAEAPKAGADSTAAASGDATIYIVKSGDILMKIAKEHNTTVKTIQALNDMKTSAIKAGQKLKVPVMKMASADVDNAPAAAAAAPASAPALPAPAVKAN
ncbi:MAG: LysM peptidoglycan-binding domain-containing protein [Verrucomicrobiota bacterium]